MVISVINHKGGTGKTSISVNLAAALAFSGYKVLLIDLTSQASASFHLGVARSELPPSIADVLFDRSALANVIRQTNISGLDLVTGGWELAHSDSILAAIHERENGITKAIKSISADYNFIICDCAPSLSTLSVNALAASDYYLIPITPQYLALEGLISLLEAISGIKNEMGLSAELLGIVINMVGTENKLTKSQAMIIDLVREHYQEDVFTTCIKQYAKLEEAPAYGCSIFEYAPNSPASHQYGALFQEVIKRCGLAAYAN